MQNWAELRLGTGSYTREARETKKSDQSNIQNKPDSLRGEAMCVVTERKELVENANKSPDWLLWKSELTC